MISLNKLGKEAQEIAESKGFTSATPAEDLALMHSELSEALEDIRIGRPLNALLFEDLETGEIVPGHQGDNVRRKPVGVPSEMADVIIRVAHFCAKHGIDLDTAVEEKMGYNMTRPYRHGNKVL